MQEEIAQKSAALMINSTKFCLRTLKTAAIKLLARRQNPSTPGVKRDGTQTVRQLVGQNQGVSNVELSGEDIKAEQYVVLEDDHIYRIDQAQRGYDSDGLPITTLSLAEPEGKYEILQD